MLSEPLITLITLITQIDRRLTADYADDADYTE